MKRIFLLTICLCTIGTVSLTYADILKIDAERSSIQESIKSLEVTTVNISGHSTEGGAAKVYRDNRGNIHHLVVHLYFESRRKIEKFYFKNNSIILANYQYFRYNVPFNVTPELAKEIGSEPFDPEKTKFTEEKFYFEQKRMVQWLNEKAELVALGSKKFKEREQEILGACRTFPFLRKSTPTNPLCCEIFSGEGSTVLFFG